MSDEIRINRQVTLSIDTENPIIVPFMINPYFPSLLGPTLSIFEIASLGNFKFLTPKKILNSGITRITNIRGVLSQDYDLSGLSVINDSIILLDETNPTNISIGLQFGDVFEAEYEAIDQMNQYDQLVSVYQSPSYYLYPNYFTLQIFSKIEIFEVTSITNYTKGYQYDVSDALIIGNKTIFIKNSSNVGKTLDLTDIVFAEYVTIIPLENPAPTLTYGEEKYLTTNISIYPV